MDQEIMDEIRMEIYSSITEFLMKLSERGFTLDTIDYDDTDTGCRVCVEIRI